jgi:hypothetical protein
MIAQAILAVWPAAYRAATRSSASFIHLDRRSPPHRLPTALVRAWCRSSTTSRPRSCSCTPTACSSARQVLFVALEMLDSGQFRLATLANSLQDLLRRNRLSPDTVLRLAGEITDLATSDASAHRPDLPPYSAIAAAFTERTRELRGVPPPAWPTDPEPLDYVALVDAEHANRRDRRRDGHG